MKLALVLILVLGLARILTAQEKPTHAEVYAAEVKAARDRCEAELTGKLAKAYAEIEQLKAERKKLEKPEPEK